MTETSYTTLRAEVAAGHLDTAMAGCRQRLASDPKDAQALTILARIGLKLRRSDMIEGSLHAALDSDPDSVEAMTLLATYYRDLTRFAEAKALSLKALAVAPDDPDALVSLGRCLLEQWSNEEAVESFQHALSLKAATVGAYDGLGIALARLQRTDEAKAAFEQAVTLDPDSGPPYVGLTLTGGGEAVFERALGRFADSSDRLTELGRTYWQRGAPVYAERCLRRAIELDPTAEFPRRILGRLLQEVGRFTEAHDVVRDAIAAHPTNVLLYEELAFSTKFGDEDRPFLAPMMNLLRSRGMDPADRRRLNFALGKAYDDLGEYGRAMQHFDEANGIAHMQLWPRAFNRDEYARGVDETIATYTREFFERNAGLGDPTDVPILIVGMIRSGTTLVEQIVSSHPSVGPAGEVSFLVDHSSGVVDANGVVDRQRLEAYTGGYMRRLRWAVPSAPKITDKMPHNFVVAGLAHLAFPNARIIHTRRSPLDTCLSIYVTPSIAVYAHDFADIAFYYRQYQRLMAHWREVLPKGRLFELDYEELIRDREAVVRRLVEFLSLTWDDALLHHESNARAIETPSKWQARQPVYSSSVERWRRYAPWIGALLREFPEFASP